ncbi:hypothetical protein D3C80_2138340 [compost metagenome]
MIGQRFLKIHLIALASLQKMQPVHVAVPDFTGSYIRTDGIFAVRTPEYRIYDQLGAANIQ